MDCYWISDKLFVMMQTIHITFQWHHICSMVFEITGNSNSKYQSTSPINFRLASHALSHPHDECQWSNSETYGQIKHMDLSSMRIQLQHNKTMCISNYNEIIWASCIIKSLATKLFIWQLVKANNKEKIKALHYWPFVMGIQQSLVESPPKETVMLKVFPCHKITMFTGFDTIYPWLKAK